MSAPLTKVPPVVCCEKLAKIPLLRATHNDSPDGSKANPPTFTPVSKILKAITWDHEEESSSGRKVCAASVLSGRGRATIPANDTSPPPSARPSYDIYSTPDRERHLRGTRLGFGGGITPPRPAGGPGNSGRGKVMPPYTANTRGE